MFRLDRLLRTLILTLLVASGALMLGACRASKTEITFVFMRTSDVTQPYWEQVIRDFEAANPTIHVNLHVFTWDEGPGKIAEMVKQGRPPNLARVATRSIPEYVAAGWVEPVDTYMNAQFRSEFIPALINEGAQYQGRTFGIPVTASTRVLYYNKDLFRKAGVANPPQNWDELRAAAVKISQLGNGVYGFGLQGNKVETNTYFYYFLWGNGGSVLTTDGIRAAFNGTAGVQALTFLRGLIEAGATQPDPTVDDRNTLEDGFAQGRYGMVITATKLAKRLDGDKPFEYGLAPIPVQTTSTTLGVVDDMILFKQAANKAEAWKFVEFIYQDRYRRDYALREGVLPEKSAVAADPQISTNATTAFFLKQLPVARFEPINIKNADIANLVIAAVQNVYRGKETPQAALDAAAAKANELLAYSATAW